MNTITLYHGSHEEIKTPEQNRCMYFTSDINVAKEYALGLDDCGNYNEKSFIYSIEVNKDEFILIEEFEEFDPIGYIDFEDMPEKCYNEESEYYCLKNVPKLNLVENYKNEL